jgi:DNA-binding PadR family transcriptional regulator
MDKSLTNAEFAILSLLVETPRHGYEIERAIEERGMREWTEIGFSSIYFLLKKLEALGLVERTGAATASRREPKTFRPTEAGRALHVQETRRAIAEPKPLFPALLLGLANWPVLDRQAALAAVTDRSVALGEAFGRLEGRRSAQAPLPRFVEAMFDYSLTMIAAERAWLERTCKSLEEKMEKTDFRKEFKVLYNPPADRFEIVDVPPITYFMIDGSGDPNLAAAYREAVEALYAASYTLKFMSKAALARDYVVPPLEGLWWAQDMTSFVSRQKDKWSWTMMIMVPDFVEGAMAEQAIAAAAKKKQLPALKKVRIERLQEGKSVQIMHIGPYDAEGPVLKRLHEEFLPANGLIEAGHHHEIYLGDPRKSAPEKLKTVLRQPVRPR